jgi:hypothetical protein
MRTPSRFLLLPLLTALLILGCSPEKEELQVETIPQYLPLQAGKFITYRLDSLVFTQAGRGEETHYYEEKNIVDAQIADNLGRPAYRVFRYLRDTSRTQAWRPSGSYFITPLENSAEVIEDNMRVIKLVAPIAEGKTWKGNRFLTSEPFGAKFNFSNDDAMGDWDFITESTQDTAKFGSQLLNNVITITSIDESLNAPVRDAGAYGARTFATEKFAKGVGSVYQEFIMWEYQPNSGGTPYKVGFGVKRSMIDHN